MSSARHGEFERLAREHQNALLRVAGSLTKNGADAEDLVQDTLLRAFRFFHKFESGTNFKAWAIRILKNLFFNNCSRNKRAPASVSFEMLEKMTADDPTSDRMELGETVDKVLRQLPRDYRHVTLLAGMGSLKYSEIAEVLGVPAGTVMSRLFRARRMLGVHLAEWAA